ncbi:MAG: PfkB family carbohydrate kinase [Candidatus Brocadiia bacterium]
MELAKRLTGIARPRVLVVGDLILDRYVWGSVDRISPEAPIPVLKVTAEDERPGGAGSVAVNLANLGAEVVCAGILGDDPEADTVRRLLEAHEIDHDAVTRFPRRHTTVKSRVIARVQQVIRVDREDPAPIPDDVASRLLDILRPQIRRADAVLLSDYNKGLLTPGFVAPLVEVCREEDKTVLADPARGADPSRFRGVTAICPNRAEAAEAAGLPDEPANLDKIARRLIRRLELDACVVTRDRDGISLYRGRRKPLHIPARAREVFDVTGAGDMVLSILGLVLAGGGSFEEATEIANVAGGLEVGKLGVVPLSRDEIVQELERGRHSPASKVRSREELVTIVRSLKAQERTVVFTNGCFDLLNANHIALLRHAKSLGDVLIVATNSDASIRRLKGPRRPILSEAERLELLSAVHHVDYVIAFAEDTPRPLLRLLQPDILVKGGDYKRKEDVVGWQIVEEYGGRIERAPMTRYSSTSGIVEKVLNSPEAEEP